MQGAQIIGHRDLVQSTDPATSRPVNPHHFWSMYWQNSRRPEPGSGAPLGSRGSAPRLLGLTMGWLLDRTFGERPRASRIVHEDDKKAIQTWEEVMPKLVGFSRFAALLEEQISDKISRRILSGACRKV